MHFGFHKHDITELGVYFHAHSSVHLHHLPHQCHMFPTDRPMWLAIIVIYCNVDIAGFHNVTYYVDSLAHHTSMSTLHTSLISRTLWLPRAWYYRAWSVFPCPLRCPLASIATPMAPVPYSSAYVVSKRVESLLVALKERKIASTRVRYSLRLENDAQSFSVASRKGGLIAPSNRRRLILTLIWMPWYSVSC